MNLKLELLKPFKIFALLLGVALIVISCTRTEIRQEKIRIIIDTDTNNELDDQHAIAYVLLNGQIFNLEGITVNKTGSGNIKPHIVEARRIVKLIAPHSNIKVLRGANGNYEQIDDHIHRKKFDGHKAVNFIIKRAKAKNQGKLVILALGKLTNIALALKKNPSIASKIRIVWLGSNYPEPGEYNLLNDPPAINPILSTAVDFEMAAVRNDKSTGAAAVKVDVVEIQNKMPGMGPKVETPVTGRHGGQFTTFGDYSANLFQNIPGKRTKARSLYDIAAVAILKNPSWAQRVEVNMQVLVDNWRWVDQPGSTRKIVIWDNFEKNKIIRDFFHSMKKYRLAKPVDMW